MAAAVIPIIAQVAGIVAPLLPDIIRGVEAVFKAPKSGEDRMDVAVSQVRAVVDKKAARGEIPAGTMPTDAELRALIEGEFQRMKTEGLLTAAPAPVALSGMFLLKGRMVPFIGFDLLG